VTSPAQYITKYYTDQNHPILINPFREAKHMKVLPYVFQWFAHTVFEHLKWKELEALQCPHAMYSEILRQSHRNLGSVSKTFSVEAF